MTNKNAEEQAIPGDQPLIRSRAGASVRSGSCSFVAFSILSLQATRNSHQFAAVVGTVTAWNFGEWAAVLRHRRLTKGGASAISSAGVSRLVAFGAVTLVLLWVGSGLFYKMTGEGRVISLGEEPLFFPHAAARFAGQPGMPDRFLSFHNGHASLFEYYHGPDRQVYTDPRLEVAGADLFKRYIDLDKLLKKDRPGWEAQLNEMGRPVILVDHEYNWEIGATLLSQCPLALRLVRCRSPRCSCTTPTHRSSGPMPSISRPGISVPIPAWSREASPS